MSNDAQTLFVTRTLRLFAYGLLSVVLVLYFKAAGLTDSQVGWLLTLTLLGDTAISLVLTNVADRWGRRRVLVAGAALMILAVAMFLTASQFWWLVIAATVGVISLSGSEVGPFLSVEQAALSQLIPSSDRIRMFAWYNLTGSFATAFGALIGGSVCTVAESFGAKDTAVYTPVLFAYGAIGSVLTALFLRLTAAVEVDVVSTTAARTSWHGVPQSRGIVARLSALFVLDAFAGGFIVQSVTAYWFVERFGASKAMLGAIFLAGNLIAGVSALAASRLAQRFGLVNTMVFTHLPSNVLLIFVPLMPNLELAAIVLFLRYSISQMDVPTRQAYVMAVVPAAERSAAAGMTAVARSLGAAASPWWATVLIGGAATQAWPFYLAGGLKIVYDLLLYVGCRNVPELEHPVRPSN